MYNFVKARVINQNFWRYDTSKLNTRGVLSPICLDPFIPDAINKFSQYISDTISTLLENAQLYQTKESSFCNKTGQRKTIYGKGGSIPQQSDDRLKFASIAFITTSSLLPTFVFRCN